MVGVGMERARASITHVEAMAGNGTDRGPLADTPTEGERASGA